MVKHGFVFNKNSDWSRNGFSLLTKVEGDSLILLPDDRESSMFVSECLDSGIIECSWGTFCFKLSPSSSAKFIFKVFATDSDEVLISKGDRSEKVSISSLFANSSNVNDKIELFRKMESLRFENTCSGPLFSLKGRYLWFCIEVEKDSHNFVKIEKLTITFPYSNLIENLPEVYQTVSHDSFMSRFLFIFQKMYQDVEKIIDDIPRNFESERSNEDFILWISQWFNIDSLVWKDHNLELLIGRIINILRSKGTRKSILDILQFYTNSKTLLIEKMNITDNEFYKRENSLIDRLFGENDYFFTVIIMRKQIKNNFDYANILKIMNSFSPIDSLCNLVILDNNISLGSHCYLGINSYISNSYINDIHDSNSAIVVD